MNDNRELMKLKNKIKKQKRTINWLIIYVVFSIFIMLYNALM